MPNLMSEHVETPTKTSMIARKDGRRGTGGAPAAIMNSVNAPCGPPQGEVTSQPIHADRHVMCTRRSENGFE